MFCGLCVVLLFCACLLTSGPAQAQGVVRTYVVPVYGPLYSGPLVDVRGAWASRTPGFMPGSRVAIAGLNSPPLQAGTPPARVPAPRRTASPEPAPGGDEFYLAPRPEPEADAGQAKVVRSFENVMEDRPLVEGTVERVGATGVLVRYEQGGEMVSGRFDHSRVFFFQDEQLASGSSRPELLQPGMKVLVPQPEPASAVAGVREERRILTRPTPRRTAAPRRPAAGRGARRPAK